MFDLLESYDPFAPAVMADPLRYYEVLRNESPVHYVQEYDAFVVTRFQDVWDVLGDVDGSFLSTEGSLPTAGQLRVHNDGAVADPPMDPIGNANSFGSPVYEQFRHAQGKGLRPGAVRRLEDMIRGLAVQRLDQLLPRGTFDLTQDYGGHVSAAAVCHLLGLSTDHAKEVLDIVNGGTTTHDRTADQGLDLVGLLENALAVLRPAVVRQRDELEHGGAASGVVANGLLQMDFGGRSLTDAEVARNMICIFVGGTETVPKVTAHGLWELARHPDQLAQVREDLAANLVVAREEFFRYCAPAQWFARTVRRPVTVAGVEMRPGQRVLAVIASASRDEREYDDPDAFRWDRRIERSVTFGRGQHFCVGYHLARLEVAVLAEEFLKRVEEYEIDEDAAVRHPSSFQWGWNQVPVTVRRVAESE